MNKKETKKHTNLVCNIGYRFGKLTGHPIYDVEVAVTKLSIDRLKELSKMDDEEFRDSVVVELL